MRKETIGNITLYCGDYADIVPTLPPGSVDAVITDPPYGVTHNEWDIKLDLGKFWESITPCAKKNAAFAIFSQMPFTADLLQSNRKYYRYDIIWHKQTVTGFLNAKKMPLRAHEIILLFYKNLPTYNPQKFYKDTPSIRRSKHKKRRLTSNYNSFFNHVSTGTTDGSRYPQDVIYIKYENDFFKKSNYKNHPTQKPIKIMDWLVNTYTNKSEMVLDPFMGNGTTGVSCLRMGRKFIGIEKKLEYFDIACFRIERAMEQFALLEEN